MEAVIQTYLDFLEGLLAKTQEKVEGLSIEALNWRPLDKDTNSMGVIVTHMCGATNQWIYQGLTGADVGRDRVSEFRAVVDDRGYVEASGQRETLEGLIARTKARLTGTLSVCYKIDGLPAHLPEAT